MIATCCSKCHRPFTEAELELKRAHKASKLSEAAKATWAERYASGKAYSAPRAVWAEVYKRIDAGGSPKEVAWELNMSVNQLNYALQVRRLKAMREQMEQANAIS